MMTNAMDKQDNENADEKLSMAELFARKREKAEKDIVAKGGNLDAKKGPSTEDMADRKQRLKKIRDL